MNSTTPLGEHHLLIQTRDGLPSVEGAAFLDACRQANWLVEREDWTWELCGEPRKSTGIPIGSVEFVHQTLALRGYAAPPVLNIPSELRTRALLQRSVWDAPNRKAAQKIASSAGAPLLVKPARVYRLFPTTTTQFAAEIPAAEPLFLSELLSSPIVAKWRAFLLRGRILSIRPYALDAWEFPEEHCVRTVARTVRFPSVLADFAVLQNGHTALLEVRPFFACTLHGFGGTDLLLMASAAWSEFTLRRSLL